LDYHGDMTRYAKAKSQLFETISLKHAVCNSDDEFGRAIVDSLPAQMNPVTYGLDGFVSHAKRTRRPRVLGRLRSGNRLGVAIDVFTPWGDGLLETDLIGQFNAYNLLAALAAVCTIGVPFDVALTRLSAAPSLPGRMERFGKADGQPLVVVDYAHTPEALQQVLKSVRTHCVGRLWCVFGCGGDRDPGKRPMMGAAAEAYADDIVLTSDNPRHEDPDVIIDDILTGVRDKARVRIQPDRARAIGEVLNASKAGDIVVVAGKGHEVYQEIGSERRPFSDRDLIQSLLRGTE
jgi:UDP-N-acetylmuramoyl-L-alanyl-D-glutamate--2,6-diaminopimelate ligase